MLKDVLDEDALAFKSTVDDDITDFSSLIGISCRYVEPTRVSVRGGRGRDGYSDLFDRPILVALFVKFVP